MSTAIRISTLDDDLLPVTNYDFERAEAERGRVYPIIPYMLQRDQYARGYAAIKAELSSVYRGGTINIRVKGQSTLDDLAAIRTYLLGGGLVRLAPKYYSDPSIFYDCFIDIGDLLRYFALSGEDAAGEIITLRFYELDLSNQAAVVDDELYGD